MYFKRRLLNVLTISIIFIIGILIFSENLYAARVAEIEEKFMQDAGNVIRTRFPDTPFILKVKITPLRRVVSQDQSNSAEYLPFMTVFNAELNDEWDDPTISAHVLISRIRSATINISLPTSINEIEINELKDALYSSLRLKPGRDTIIIEPKHWRISNVRWWYYASGFGLLFLLLLVFLMINNLNISKLSKAITLSKASSPFPSSTDAISRLSANNLSSTNKTRSKPDDIVLTDPFKIKQNIREITLELSKLELFPNLHDMIVFDTFVKQNPESTGALILEFPQEIQNKILFYSTNIKLLDAIHDSNFLDYRSLEILQKLQHNYRVEGINGFEELKILIWRMEKDLQIKFIKSIEKNIARFLLLSMPKSISMPLAKAAFPGAWAFILESTLEEPDLKNFNITELKNKALMLKPLNDMQTILKYKSDKELMLFLQIAEFHEEEEIYEAISKDSKIHNLRPPFYTIFKADEALLKEFSSLISLDMWILSLIEVPLEYRQAITNHFTDKKRFLFEEKINNMNAEPDIVNKTREKIAKEFEIFNLKFNENKHKFAGADTGAKKQVSAV